MSHNCNKCKFKGFVPGSAHISCTVLRSAGYNDDVALLELFMSLNKVELVNTTTNKPLVEIDEHGRKNGWANYPLDFDPTWIKSCSYYTEHEKTPI